MKIYVKGREFPLVALVLIALSLLSLVIAIHRTRQMVTAINSDEEVMFVYAQPPFGLFEGEVYDSDFDLRIPELTPVTPQYEKTADQGVLKLADITFEQGEYNTVKVPRRIEVDGYTFVVDPMWDEEVSIKDSDRSQAVLAAYGPKTLALYVVSLLSICASIALLSSYKKSYVTRRNVVLIRIVTGGLLVVWGVYFLARFYYLVGYMGAGESLASSILDWFFVKSILLPGLLSLGAIVGLSHVVVSSMKTTIELKEENDGTI